MSGGQITSVYINCPYALRWTVKTHGNHIHPGTFFKQLVINFNYRIFKKKTEYSTGSGSAWQSVDNLPARRNYFHGIYFRSHWPQFTYKSILAPSDFDFNTLYFIAGYVARKVQPLISLITHWQCDAMSRSLRLITKIVGKRRYARMWTEIAAHSYSIWYRYSFLFCIIRHKCNCAHYIGFGICRHVVTHKIYIAQIMLSLLQSDHNQTAVWRDTRKSWLSVDITCSHSRHISPMSYIIARNVPAAGKCLVYVLVIIYSVGLLIPHNLNSAGSVTVKECLMPPVYPGVNYSYIGSAAIQFTHRLLPDRRDSRRIHCCHIRQTV